MIMDHKAALEVFKTQTQNTQHAESALRHIKSVINQAYKRNKPVVAEIQTKVFVLTFSTWAEVKFSKLIHTPYGFSLDEIEQIKSKRNLEEMWNKCIELALRKVSASKNSGDVPNKSLKINRIVREFIIEPRLLRNKIAHGQWKIALNSENTANNFDTTSKLDNLDVVKIEKWIQVYKLLSNIIEDLIESPNKAHRNNYWLHLDELENYLLKTEKWSLESKKQKLQMKPLITPQKDPPEENS